MKNVMFILFGVLVAGASANAENLTLGIPSYGGSGCPQGTVSTALSPDATQLSILFDAYSAEAGGSRIVDRKSCNIAIPVHVPHGLSISVFQVDYRGYNSLPAGASSQLDVEYFFANRAGPRMSRMFSGATDSNYYISNRLTAASIVWSACGQDVNLRVNSSIRARTNGFGEQAMATVDSVDVSNGLRYQIQWRTCL